MKVHRHKACLCRKFEALSSQVSSYLSPICANVFNACLHGLNVSRIRINPNRFPVGFPTRAITIQSCDPRPVHVAQKFLEIEGNTNIQNSFVYGDQLIRQAFILERSSSELKAIKSGVD